METSQAVSMLQPFRHPKPGLIIMDKVKEIRDVIMKIYFESGMKNIPHSEMIEEQISVIRNGMDEYVRQVSKGIAVEFLKSQDVEYMRKFSNRTFNYMFNEWYNEWIKNQQ